MTSHRILNIALAIAVIGLWMAAAAHFDQKVFESDIRHFQNAQVQQRKHAAALKICGPGAAPRWVDDTTLECSLHTGRGKPVITAGVTL